MSATEAVGCPTTLAHVLARRDRLPSPILIAVTLTVLLSLGASAGSAAAAPTYAAVPEEANSPATGDESTAETSSKPLEVSGSATWTLSAGFGDAEGLKGTRDDLGRPDVAQRIQLTLSGEVVPGIEIDGHLDNLAANNIQRLTLTMTRGDWAAKFGDLHFTPANPSLARSASLKGVQVNGPIGPLDVSGTFARAQGVPAVKTFTGQHSDDTLRLVPDGPYAPTRTGPILEAEIMGALYFPLGDIFDPDFEDAYIHWRDGETPDTPPGRSLLDVLTANNLGELVDGPAGGGGEGVLAADDNTLLGPGAFAAVTPSSESFLLLKQEPQAIVRQQLVSLIDQFNRINQLEGEERLHYPYSAGTTSDAAFLDEVVEHNTTLALGADETSAVPVPNIGGLDAGLTGRFYNLGQEEIEPGSVEITVEQGDQEFDPDDVPGLRPAVHYEEGVLDLGPDAKPVLDRGLIDAIEVQYSYEVQSNLYVLGAALTVGSEKVYLNGDLLERDVDYMIDYGTGVLIPLVPIGPDDQLRVEFETFRGGLGGSGRYQRNFYAAQSSFSPLPGWTLDFEVLSGRDVVDPTAPRDTLREMPNAHTVLGLRSRYESGVWEADLQLAQSDDRFPFDDNERLPRPNRITSLAGPAEGDSTGESFLVAADQNGVAVWAPGAASDEWDHYGIGQGPVGTPVSDVAIDPEGLIFVATGGGLTVADATAEAAGGDVVNKLDQVDNWHRYYENDGLPSNRVQAVAVVGDRVLVGTDDGLARAELGAFPDDDPEWHDVEDRIGGDITVLAPGPLGDALYIGGPRGLSRSDGESEPVFVGDADVRAVAMPPAEPDSSSLPVYVGGAGGLFRVDGVPPAPSLTLVSGAPAVRSLAYWEEKLWIATGDGLWVIDQPGDPGHPGAEPRRVALANVPLASISVGPLPDASPNDPRADTALWVGTDRIAGATDQSVVLWAIADPVSGRPATEFTFGAAGLSPDDEYRFRDIPAEEHAADGWRGSLDVTRRLDGRGQVYFSALRQERDYLPLGSTKRQDVTAWEGGAHWLLTENVELSASHGREFHEPVERDPEPGDRDRPRHLWQSASSIAWSPGPTLTLTYERDRLDEHPDEQGDDLHVNRIAATVGHDLWGDRVTVTTGLEQVDYDDLRDPDESYKSQNVVAGLTARLLDGLTFDADYVRPLRSEGADERLTSRIDTFDYALRWDGNVGAVALDAEYEDERSTETTASGKTAGSQPTEADTRRPNRTRTVTASAEGPAWSVVGASVSPTVHTDWRKRTSSYLQDRVRTGAGADVKMEWSTFDVTATGEAAQTVYDETEKREDVREVGVIARFTRWDNLTPSLKWSRKAQAAARPGFGTEAKRSQTGVMRLTWLPLPGLSSTQSISYRSQHDRRGVEQHASLASWWLYTINDATSLDWTIESSLKSDKATSVPQDPERRTRIELGAGHNFSDSRRAELSLGRIWGVKSSVPYISYYADVSVRLRF